MNKTEPVLALLKNLVARASITPEDAGCLDLIESHLKPLGFNCERLPSSDVDNLWARLGSEGPLFVFLGHTDVVPPGPAEKWHSPPFEPTIRDGNLYGRGTADMKSGVAAMICAVETVIQSGIKLNGSIAFLLTSDEEGPAIHGTRKVIEVLEDRGEKIDYCLVGEPSSLSQLGDVVRIGRRGSLGGLLKVKGKQGHVAYPHLAQNPIHQAAQALAELTSKQWDEGGHGFPATTFQISNIHAGTGASNVIPGELDVVFNFRHGVVSSAESLQQQVHDILDNNQLNYELEWQVSGAPFVTEQGALVDAVQQAVQAIEGIEPDMNTGGGTSDGRFVAPTGAQVVELGPINATIHQVNEHVRVSDLPQLEAMYKQILLKLLT